MELWCNLFDIIKRNINNIRKRIPFIIKLFFDIIINKFKIYIIMNDIQKVYYKSNYS